MIKNVLAFLTTKWLLLKAAGERDFQFLLPDLRRHRRMQCTQAHLQGVLMGQDGGNNRTFWAPGRDRFSVGLS